MGREQALLSSLSKLRNTLVSAGRIVIRGVIESPHAIDTRIFGVSEGFEVQKV